MSSIHLLDTSHHNNLTLCVFPLFFFTASTPAVGTNAQQPVLGAAQVALLEKILDVVFTELQQVHCKIIRTNQHVSSGHHPKKRTL